MNEIDRSRDELGALGETSVDADEFEAAKAAFAGADASVDGGDEDVAVVAALFRVSEPVEAVELADEASRRTWEAIDARLASRHDRTRRGVGRRGVLAALVTLAAAAAVALSWMPPGAGRDDVELLGEQARLGLRALGGDAGHEAADAEALADRYATALARERGLEW